MTEQPSADPEATESTLKLPPSAKAGYALGLAMCSKVLWETAVNIKNDQSQGFSERLAIEIEERPDLMVLIRPDARVETRRLVRVFGIASSVGIERFGIAAQPLSEE